MIRPRDDKQSGANIVDSMRVALQHVTSEVPASNLEKSSEPMTRWRELAAHASRDAAGLAEGWDLPRGDIHLVAALDVFQKIWLRQARFVADVFAAAGRSDLLNTQILTYCLFRHAATPMFRDMVSRLDRGSVIELVSEQAWTHRLDRIAARILMRMRGRVLARSLSAYSSVGLPAFAYFETCLVAKSAMELLIDRITVITAARKGRQTQGTHSKSPAPSGIFL